MNDQVSSDVELLSLARSILVDEGYIVEQLVGEVVLLLAENPYFVVGIAAAPTIAQLLLAQSIAETQLSERLTSSDVGPKRWDAYLVLLTQERSPEDSEITRELFNINYDTSALRRIAHSGVDATLSSVRNALTPFVAPLSLDDALVADGSFDALVEAVTIHGVDRELVEKAVAAFRQGVHLGDVL